MNRFFSFVTLLLSLCALLTTCWLWQDIRAKRQEAASQPLRHRISDERFTDVKEFVDFVHTAYDKGFVPRSDVLTADGLLNKARYMHGDISRAEWYRLLNKSAGEQMRLADARFRSGAGSLADVLVLQNDVLESSR